MQQLNKTQQIKVNLPQEYMILDLEWDQVSKDVTQIGLLHITQSNQYKVLETQNVTQLLTHLNSSSSLQIFVKSFIQDLKIVPDLKPFLFRIVDIGTYPTELNKYKVYIKDQTYYDIMEKNEFQRHQAVDDCKGIFKAIQENHLTQYQDSFYNNKLTKEILPLNDLQTKLKIQKLTKKCKHFIEDLNKFVIGNGFDNIERVFDFVSDQEK